MTALLAFKGGVALEQIRNYRLPCGTECYLRWLQHLANVQEK